MPIDLPPAEPITYGSCYTLKECMDEVGINRGQKISYKGQKYKILNILKENIIIINQKTSEAIVIGRISFENHLKRGSIVLLQDKKKPLSDGVELNVLKTVARLNNIVLTNETLAFETIREIREKSKKGDISYLIDAIRLKAERSFKSLKHFGTDENELERLDREGHENMVIEIIKDTMEGRNSGVDKDHLKRILVFNINNSGKTLNHFASIDKRYSFMLVELFKTDEKNEKLAKK